MKSKIELNKIAKNSQAEIYKELYKVSCQMNEAAKNGLYRITSEKIQSKNALEKIKSKAFELGHMFAVNDNGTITIIWE